MSEESVRRRTDRIAHQQTFQILTARVTLRTDCHEVAQKIGYLSQDARQEFAVCHAFSYEILRREDHFEVFCGKEHCASERELWLAIFSLQRLIHGRVFEMMDDVTRIHAGWGSIDGKAFLIVGDSLAGKTTLVTRLLYGGIRIGGDELVLVRDGRAMPFPRRFHIKSESLRLLPQLRPLVETMPFVTKDNGLSIYAFSPTEAGFDWSIEYREVKHLFFLESNHGGRSWAEVCPKHRMVQHLMPRSYFSESQDYRKIGELCGMVNEAACFTLHVGDLDAATGAVREILEAG